METADPRIGNRAFTEIVELPKLAAQRDVDGHHHLLHRRITVDPMGPHVAGPIDNVTGSVVDRRQTFEHLLIGRRINHGPVGRRIWWRRAAPIVDHALDGGAVDLLQRAELAVTGALAIERRRIDDEHVFEQRAQPRLPARNAIGPLEEALDRSDARANVGVDCDVAGSPPPSPQEREVSRGRARTDAPALALPLVLARMDDEAKKIVDVGKTAQFGKADRLVGTRLRDKVVARRIIEAPSGNVRRGDGPQWIEWAEPIGTAAAHDAFARAIGHLDLIRRQRPIRLARAACLFAHDDPARHRRWRTEKWVGVPNARPLRDPDPGRPLPLP